MTYIFDNSECSIPAIDAPVYPLITNCHISEVPEPIFEAPLLEIPLDIPPELPCPTFNIGAVTTTTGSGGWAYSPSVYVTSDRTSNSISCETTLDFHFDLPIPLQVCPDVFAEANSNLNVEESADPSFNVGVVATRVIGEVEDASHCGFNFDFDIDLTLPAPVCPTMSIASVLTTVTDPGLDPDVEVTATQAEGSDCGLVFDFAFTLPRAFPAICPDVNAHAAATIGAAGTPSVTVITTQVSEPSHCAFDFDFDFQLPSIMCTTLSTTATASLTNDPSPSLEVVATNLTEEKGSCAYGLDFNLMVPQQCTAVSVVPPVITVDDTLSVPRFTGNATNGGSPGGCTSILDFEFKTPRQLEEAAYIIKAPAEDDENGTDCYAGETADLPPTEVRVIHRSTKFFRAKKAKVSPQPTGGFVEDPDGETICVRTDLMDGVAFTGDVCYVTQVFTEVPDSDVETPTDYFWNGGPAGHNFKGRLLANVGALGQGEVEVAIYGREDGAKVTFDATNLHDYPVRSSESITARFCDHLQKFDFQTLTPKSSRGSGSTASNCECCDCFQCLAEDEVVIGGCTDCPNGAAYAYFFNAGNSIYYPELFREITVTFAGDCLWRSSDITTYDTVNDPGHTQPIKYRWEYAPFTINGRRVMRLRLIHVSGPDPLGLSDDE